MWNEKSLKMMPGIVFLLCVLEIFELVLTIDGMNKNEKLEVQLRQNLEMLEKITALLNEHLEGIQLEHCKRIKIK